MKQNTKQLSMPIPEELYNAVSELADCKYISIASAVRIALAEWVEHEKLKEQHLQKYFDNK